MTTTTPNASPHIDQVRQVLMDTLADLRDRKNPMEIKRALAIKDVAGALIDTARVENEYLKLTGQDHSKFLEIPPDASVAHLGITVTPGDRNGITSITQHKLRG